MIEQLVPDIQNSNCEPNSQNESNIFSNRYYILFCVSYSTIWMAIAGSIQSIFFPKEAENKGDLK